MREASLHSHRRLISHSTVNAHREISSSKPQIGHLIGAFLFAPPFAKGNCVHLCAEAVELMPPWAIRRNIPVVSLDVPLMPFRAFKVHPHRCETLTFAAGAPSRAEPVRAPVKIFRRIAVRRWYAPDSKRDMKWAVLHHEFTKAKITA